MSRRRLQLTITITGDEFSDLQHALTTIKPLIDQEYLSGQDKNDTGRYYFEVKEKEVHD